MSNWSSKWEFKKSPRTTKKVFKEDPLDLDSLDDIDDFLEGQSIQFAPSGLPEIHQVHSLKN